MQPPARILLSLALALQLAMVAQVLAAEEISVPVADDNEIIVDRYPAEGDYLLLWFAPEYGFRQAHRSMAQRLPGQGIEVWQADVVESLFLPQGSTSLKQLEGGYVADLIEYAHATSGKKIAVAGDSYAAMTALLGARSWQQREQGAPYLVGAVLFTPYSYAYIPPLGLAPEYLPIVESTNIPLMIYQSKNSATFNRFDELLEKLRKNESPVYTRLVPEVMSLFYEEEPSNAMLTNADAVARNLKQMLPMLARHALPDRPVPLGSSPQAKSGIDIYLKEFRGQTRPAALALPDIDGNTVTKSDFAGKVTVVNFWATWCPPCIEEIPSLNRLQRKMAGQPFELISINYAEDRETVIRFLKRVKVDFPVLLDRNGDYAKRWNVISYPSTFVIDSSGQIRYGVNAAIEWDAPEITSKLEALMN